MTTTKILAVAALGLAGAGTLSGCASGLSNAAFSSGTTTGAVKPAISGSVHGGQQPIIGATVQLYAVGTTGLKSASTPILNKSAQTQSNGSFSVGGDYSCSTPVAASEVYLVVTGGNSGTNGTNSAIALMAPLGDCNTVLAAVNAGTYPSISINELTTVAAVYALAPFMKDYAHVGASGVEPAGLVNAFANFNNLINLSAGTVGGANLNADATLPTSQIDSLANLLAVCVNTSSGSGICNSVLGPTGATDTIGAMLAIANNPASPTYTALESLVVGTPPYQPSLSGVPSDWTVAISYKPTGSYALATPYNIAIDSGGDAWVTNASGSSVVELSPVGAPLTTLTGALVQPKGIAIDKSGNVWVTNPTAGRVVDFVGGAGSGISYTVGSGPVAVAIDSAGTAWVANQLSNSVSSVGAGGVVTSFTAGGTLNAPAGVAIDSGTGSGNIYVANSGGGNVVKLTNAGAAATGSPFTDNALQGTSAVALDSSNNVYALGSTTGTTLASAVSQFTSTGTAASYSPAAPATAAVTGFYPGIVAVGTGQVLVSNSVTSGSLVLETLGSTTTTASYGSLNTPVGLAVDGSGDVWVADSGDNTIWEFIGLTSPVVTPIAANVGP